MKLELLKNKLKDVVSLAEKATGKNLSLPILGSVLLEAKDNSLCVKSTNLDVGLEVEIPAKIIEEGSVAVNAGIVNNFLGSLSKEDKVKIDSAGDNIHISTSVSSTLIKCYSAEEFPMIPRVEDGISFVLNVKDVVSGLKSVLYAASLSDIKPEISSVYIYPEEGDLVFVATDSFRLAEKKISLRDKNKDFQPVIIPFKNVAEIVRVFENRDGDIQVDTSKNQISFSTDNIYFTSRVIDGNFPDYRQIMPTSFKTEATINKETLINSLKLANIFSDKFNQIEIKVIPKDKLLEINSKNQDIGENTVSVESQLTGIDMDVTFNVKYILDCFQSIPGDTISLRFADKNRPLLISGVGDSTFNYIVMPINK